MKHIKKFIRGENQLGISCKPLYGITATYKWKKLYEGRVHRLLQRKIMH